MHYFHGKNSKNTKYPQTIPLEAPERSIAYHQLSPRLLLTTLITVHGHILTQTN